MPSTRRRLRLRSYQRPATGAYSTPSLDYGMSRKKKRRKSSLNNPAPAKAYKRDPDNESDDDDSDDDESDDDERMMSGHEEDDEPQDGGPKILQPDPAWDKVFRRLLAYKRKHGNTHVPQRRQRDSQLSWFVQ